MMNAQLDYKSAKLLHPGLGKRIFNNSVKATLATIAEDWHDEMLPRHFTEEGAREYGYYLRKGQGLDRSGRAFQRSYTGRKLREKGHELPLVFSGEGRGLARLRKINATNKQASVVLPSKFSFRNPKSRIDMRAELTATTQSEESQLRKTAQTRLAQLLNQGNAQ